VTPEEAAAEKAAKTAALKRLTASTRYLISRYGHLSGVAAQVAASLNQVTSAWSAAGGNGSTDPAAGAGSVSAGSVSAGGGGSSSASPAPGVAWGSAGGAGGGGGNGGNGSNAGGSGSGAAGNGSYGVPQQPGSGGGGGGVYAPGGLVVSSGGMAPVYSAGFDSEPRFIAGSVTGYRWWTIAAPDVNGNPLDADADWDPERTGLLRGAWAYWQPGVNTAVCLADPDGKHIHDPGQVPERSCGDGFWAYWGAQRHELGRTGTLPVFGVIKGWGKTLTGPHGFRCAKARILAVHLPLVIGNKKHLEAEARRQHEAAIRHYRGRPLPEFTGRVINIGTDHVPWPLTNVRPTPDPGPEPTPEEIAADKAKGEAWMAVIGDRIGQLYPGVDVCETRAKLLTKYPPDRVYGRGPQY
jgi:hypothetical protein